LVDFKRLYGGMKQIKEEPFKTELFRAFCMLLDGIGKKTYFDLRRH